MNINSIDLKTFKKPLEDSLRGYEAVTGLKFSDFPDFTLTPEKPNFARTIIPVNFESEKVGDLYAIIFVKGDGTGDLKTYKLNEIIIPPRYVHKEKPERVIPRSKTGIIAEGCLPLFSMSPSGYIAMFATSLDELSLVDNKIGQIWKLGESNVDYLKALRGDKFCEPQIFLTVGESFDGKRKGDPHSVYYDKNTQDAIQVSGFLGISDMNNPILEMSKYWVRK